MRLPPGRALVARGPLLHILASSQSFYCLLCLEKIIKKIRGNWTLFGIDFLENQKQAKKQQLALGTKLIGQYQKMI